MASNPYNPRNPSTPQSIPLQDLARPPDSHDITDEERRHSRGGLSRGRNLLRNRQSIGSRGAFIGRYEKLKEDSPSPTERNAGRPARNLAVPENIYQSPYYEEGPYSPLEDGAGFQDAMGFTGLSFQGETASQPGPEDSPALPVTPRVVLEIEGEATSQFSRPIRSITEDSQHYSPFETDTTPLTDTNYLQPISGTQRLSGGRPSFQSVQFTPPSGSRARSMLGDDLPNIDTGPRRSGGSVLSRSGSYRDRARSLSTAAAGSPLLRASSMVRKMSQRIVNLSNEPEIVEQSIRRTPSLNEGRLAGPPSFPAMVDYTYNESSATPSPIEKAPPLVMVGKPQPQWQQPANPLKGNTLGIMPPTNKFRMFLCDVLVHPVTEPVILLLIVMQTVLLAIESAPSVYLNPRSPHWRGAWMDYGLLILFIIYTLEIIARIIVSGFIINPEEYSTIDRRKGFKNAVIEKTRSLISPQRQNSRKQTSSSLESQQPSILRSFTGIQAQIDQPGHTEQQQRVRLARRAFLRHGFNRLDFVAVVSFWISFALRISGQEAEQKIYVFRMLSCLRTIRLLGLTSGTSVILRSLKRAAPLLLNVAFLISFFWLLFAIVGVQSFGQSFRRNCVWVDPEGKQNNFTNSQPGNLQFCGGHLDKATKAPMPWLLSDGVTPGARSHKGFLCPQYSYCIQGENPYNGTVSFDNVLQSLELVFVIMSSNTFSDLLYYTTESEYLAAALFFAAGIFIMSLWLMNLLVAVITSSFQVIREESKTSAFTGDKDDQQVDEDETPARRLNPLKRAYERTSWIWVLVIIYGLVCQSLRSASMSKDRERFVDASETVVTFLLLFEIVLRIATDWRNFFKSKRNWVDLALAVVTTVMQIPAIRHSGQPYAWLTFFQIVRIYRVVLAVSLTRDLIMVVLGNVTGLLNLIIFVFLLTFLTAIFAVQIFRGQIPAEDSQGSTNYVTFFTVYNSFLGMYQVLSSENWTALMYNVTSYNADYSSAWIGAAFFVLWFILANFIVINMFIAVIQENFDVTEDEKRLEQVKAFLQSKDLGGSSQGNLSLSSIFRLGRDSQRRKDPLDFGPATMEMLLKDAVVKDFLDEQFEPADGKATDTPSHSAPSAPQVESGSLSGVWSRLVRLVKNRDPNPFYSRLQFSRAYEDLDPRTMAQEVVSATEHRKRAQREYLVKHPKYNVSLFLFKPSNPIRRFCQYIVGPGRGTHRIEGVEPNKVVWYSFSAFIYAAIIAMVLLACITTPLYQLEYSEQHGQGVDKWFVFTDLGFAILFTIESVIKLIADGFFWTPNAYFRGSWGFIDGIVLVTLWINVATALYSDTAVSRAIGAFKALRALRLLNVSDSARNYFHSVIVLGGWKILSAAFVSISLLIPFAIYGLNLFNGQMQLCNDNSSGISNLTDCVDEYLSSPYNWNVLAPRQAANPYYSFDDFGDSLFILFQIVSQEGWTDVMWSAESSTGRGKQPQPFASQGNALFFVVFNLLGAVFVLTLFVSVFMRNYTEQTGVAFLTAEQRSWLELRKLLRQISPSKRPSNKPSQSWRTWCYQRAVKKRGGWQRFVTTVLCLHLVLLVLEFYPVVEWWDRTRDYLFLLLTLFYIANVVIRLVGLTWPRFKRSSWDLYSVCAVSGTFITTVLALADVHRSIYTQLHKLFLVSIALLLIPRNNQLDQLFKTAAASLTAIGNLLATWLVLFLVYAIALTQTFGLTRFGGGEDGNLNFRTVPKALILLFRISYGEGWNAIMEDFAAISEPYCVSGDDFLHSDCGSRAWARALFISWNILSMYIFVSLFVSLIFESFSYVYQRSSGLSVVSREEIRRFKQAWATFDPAGTGFISKETFPRLLGELSGVFGMRIYEGEHSVLSILGDCSVDSRASEVSPDNFEGVNLKLLSQRLSKIPVHEIRRRRRRMNLFYEEVLVSADLDRGISFTSVIMILAHYNVISDNKSLRLEEFLRRRARLQRVEEAVRRNVVIGFFDTMYWARQFRRIMDARRSARMTAVPQFGVPEIFIDDEDDVTAAQRRSGNFPMSPIGPFEMGTHLGGGTRSPRSGSVSQDGRLSRAGSPSNSASRTVSPHLSPHLMPQRSSRLEDGALGSDWRLAGGLSGSPSGSRGHSRSRQGSNVSAQDVLEVLDNSAWGESIRRSFTQKRPSR
ncbi:MAG: hypothetical protein M1812_001851 [Candelaria pacifica]|nr:MAG: hypothetical protein M1812_001851 [Candelaria pacifica]